MFRWVLLGSLISANTFALDIDGQIELVKKVYDLHPKSCAVQKIFSEEEAKVGKILFDTKELSGDKDISCRSCHIDKFGSADGLPMAIGVGGHGEGYQRYKNGGALVQRNALSLKGRGSQLFKAFFWDGKAQENSGSIVTQFGSSIAGFKSTLAAASILPIVERDEFTGIVNNLKTNDIQNEMGFKLYNERYKAVGAAIRKRLVSSSNIEIINIRHGLKSVGVDVSHLELVDIGNLLAAFIANEFPCEESEWDRYLNGDHNALTPAQKEGAVLFFGKGRCASCHDGELFSDFSYHSIGSPQGSFGPHSRHRDIGRAGVTNRRDDLFKFRTPPLIGVSETAPYGHNGAFRSLREIVTHHFNPLEYYVSHLNYYDEDYYTIGKLMGSRSKLLEAIQVNTDDEIKSLVEFLRAI